MSISVTCTCGGHFRAKDSDAGKRVKCPSCHAVLVIPVHRSDFAGNHADAPARNEPAIRRCEECDAELADNAAICVSCGLNLKTGKKLAGPVKRMLEPNPPPRKPGVLGFLRWLFSSFELPPVGKCGLCGHNGYLVMSLLDSESPRKVNVICEKCNRDWLARWKQIGDRERAKAKAHKIKPGDWMYNILPSNRPPDRHYETFEFEACSSCQRVCRVVLVKYVKDFGPHEDHTFCQMCTLKDAEDREAGIGWGD